MKIDIRQAFFALATILVMVAAISNPAFAQAAAAGDLALRTLTDVITGRIGLLIGLAIVILGLWTWIIKQETGTGITMIIGGVLITLAPGMFNGARGFVDGVITQFSGGEAQSVRGFNAGAR
jgi:type IV secretory pathway VirB2 component (pilin)